MVGDFGLARIMVDSLDKKRRSSGPCHLVPTDGRLPHRKEKRRKRLEKYEEGLHDITSVLSNPFLLFIECDKF